MVNKLHLVMPMGGAGSRFHKTGFSLPKPLIEIAGKPFLFWATRSIEKYVDIADLTFVVLNDHVDKFGIDRTILHFFPEANIVKVDYEDVKSGPVMTCLAGLLNITDDQPVLFNDCDHMFRCTSFNIAANRGDWSNDGALLTFESNQPQYSYVRFDGEAVVGTVEKQVVSNQAICGAYVVKNAAMFRAMAEKYMENCEYKEYFVSGIYNQMCRNGLSVKTYTTDFHVPFGTPEEYEIAKNSSYFMDLE